MPLDAALLKDRIRDIPDWPRPGIMFRDITPLLGDADAFGAAVDAMTAPFTALAVDRVVCVEARGFLFGAPVAHGIGAALVPVRKPGKLPWDIEREEYLLEYGTDLLEVHRDGIHEGDRVLIVDDVLATGGTAGATIRLVERLGATVVGLDFLLELGSLGGREALAGYDVTALLTYE